MTNNSMSSRQRVATALQHQKTGRVPVDLGSSMVTGISVEVIPRLRKALGLKPRPVRVIEPYGMLGEMDEELIDALRVDVIGLWPRLNFLGFPNENWKPWIMDDGTAVLVPEKFNTRTEANGRIYQYPAGDDTMPPCAVMPKGGFYFDSLPRQKPLDESGLNIQDNLEDFQILADEELDYYSREVDRLFYTTDKAILLRIPGTSFGDVGNLAAPWLRDPKGIRDPEEWYVSLLTRPSYVHDVFSGQLEIALQNLELIHQAVGEKVTAVAICANDFGTQEALVISPTFYRELFLPVHKQLNQWVHAHSKWKTFLHSCGAIEPLINDFITADFDILNPVQCSAAGMDAEHLKNTYGDRICFWGGGVDTQRVLSLGTAEEVYQQVCQRIRLFGRNGGYVFSPVHCIQPRTPVENVLAMFAAIEDASNCGSEEQSLTSNKGN